MKNLIPFLVFIAFVLQGCHFSTSEVTRGYQIDNATRTEINSLDIKVYQDMQLGDFEAFNTLIAPSLKKELSYDGNRQTWSNLGQILQHKSYRMYDEINITSLIPGYNLKVNSLDSTDNSVITLTTTCRETEISFLMLEDSVSQFLMAAIYGKYNGKWLLSGFSIGCYSYFGKTAPAYYSLARKYYERGDLVDAVVNIAMCSRCLHPCKTIVTYKKATAINRFTDKLINDTKAKYGFPFTLNNIKSKPVISGIEPERLGAELVPEIDYMSGTNIKDTTRLRKENEEVQKSVGELFQGVKDNNAHILYRVSCLLPTEEHRTHTYNFVETTGKGH